MKQQNIECFQTALLWVVIIAFPAILHGRSIHRPEDQLMPSITTRMLNEKTSYQLKDSRIQERPIFKVFDQEDYESHMLPSGPITYRNHPEKSVLGKRLSELATDLLHDIQKGRKRYPGFKLLKGRDYSNHDRSGLLIFKYNNDPFILKLFIETPQGFVRPYAKGFEFSCLFIMGSAIRHMTGFTRLKNLKAIRKAIENSPEWKNLIDLPRKWYWEPPNAQWFEVIGKNVGNKKKQRIILPSVYGVIADAVKSSRPLTLANIHDRKFGMQFARFLKFRSDPHMKNYLLEAGTNKIVLIDTEHFPTLVGLKKEMTVQTYTGWYAKLAKKFLNDRLGRSKKDRFNLQFEQESFYQL